MAGITTIAGIASSLESGPGIPGLSQASRRGSGIIEAGSIGPNGLKTRRPVGFALRAANTIGSEDGYSIVILDAAGLTLLALGPFAETDVVATWRALGEASGLPLLIEHGAGDLRPACDQIGRLRLGRTRTRRRHAVLSGRRPRFLVRRKPGRSRQQALIHRKREIGSREER